MREKIISTCKKYIGIKEIPANSNNVIFNTRFYGRDVRDGDKPGASYAWCGTAVSEIFQEAGIPLGKIGFTRGYASCQYAVDNISKWGREISFDQAQPGDIVFFDWDGNGRWDHTGIVSNKLEKYNEFVSYEGNTSPTNNSNGGEFMARIRKNIPGQVKFIKPNALL